MRAELLLELNKVFAQLFNKMDMESRMDDESQAAKHFALRDYSMKTLI